MKSATRNADYIDSTLENTEKTQDQVIYLFSHGIADTSKQVYSYMPSAKNDKPYLIQKPFITFDYPDASTNIFKINRTQTSLAQDNEIECLAQTFYKKVKADQKVILVGVSRGASTIINFMAIHQPNNVAALILESPFDCVDSIIWQLANNSPFSWVPGIKKNGHGLMSFVFCKYDPNGIRPLDSIALLPKDLPIFIACSLKDSLVPAWSTINLYNALVETNHENTYLLALPEGKHAKIIKHPIHGITYQNCVHAFYQKFDLPHVSPFAQLGINILKECQPKVQSFNSFFPNRQIAIKNKNKNCKKIK